MWVVARKKQHREGGPRELNQRAPRFQKPSKFQIRFSMPKRLLYPWISSKLFRLNLWPRKATCQPYPSNAQKWNRRNRRNRRDRSWGLKIAKNWLGTIRKISGTIWKISGTIWKISGTIWKISGTIWKTSGTVWRTSQAILECTNCLANINLQIRMPSVHLQLHPAWI